MTFIDKLRRRDPSPMTVLTPPQAPALTGQGGQARNRLELRITPPGTAVALGPAGISRRPTPELGMSPTQRPSPRPSPGLRPSPGAYDQDGQGSWPGLQADAASGQSLMPPRGRSEGISGGATHGHASPRSWMPSGPMSTLPSPGLVSGPRPQPHGALAEEKAQWRSRAFNLPILAEAKTKRFLQLPNSPAQGAGQSLGTSPPPSPATWADLVDMPEMGSQGIAAWLAAVPLGTPPPPADPWDAPPPDSDSDGHLSLPGSLHISLSQYCNEAEVPQELPQRAQVADLCQVTAEEGLAELTLSGLPHLAELPDALAELTSLRRLILEGLAIEALPALSGLLNLEELVVRACPKLRTLPWGLTLIPGLRRLVLAELPHLVSVPPLPQTSVLVRNCPNLPPGLLRTGHLAQPSRNLL